MNGSSIYTACVYSKTKLPKLKKVHTVIHSKSSKLFYNSSISAVACTTVNANPVYGFQVTQQSINQYSFNKS